MRTTFAPLFLLTAISFHLLTANAAVDANNLYQGIVEASDSAIKPADTGGTTPGAYSKVQVDATSDKTSASFAVGDSLVIIDDANQSTDEGTDITFNYGLSGSTPFDSDKDKKKDLADLSGLTAGSSAKLQGSLMFWPRVDGSKTVAIDLNCDDAVKNLFVSTAGTNYRYSWPTDNPVPPNAQESALLFEDKDVTCNRMLQSVSALREAAELVNKKNKELAEKGGGFVAPAPVRVVADASQKLDRYRKTHRERVSQARGTSHGLTFSLAANRQEFAFVDVATAMPAISKDKKNGYGASVGYSAIFDRAVLLASISYEKAFKGGEETQVCVPIGTSTATQCRSAALAAPTRKSDQIASVEYRAMLPWKFKMAIAPKVQYSIENNDFGGKLPIYLNPDPKHPLDGGVAIGWTEDEQWSAGVFVGKAFKFTD